MLCLDQITIRTKYGIQHVPCGKCEICCMNRRNEWSVRLGKELQNASSAVFVTLTYDDQNVPVNEHGLLEVDKRHVQLFNKSLKEFNRKLVNRMPESSRVLQKRVKYYLVAEYGTKTMRPHYHALYFNLKKHSISKIGDLWKKGSVHVGNVNGASIHYTTKYIINKDKEGKVKKAKEFTLISKGIGEDYLEKNKSLIKKNYGNLVHGDKSMLPMPKYYKDKIYNKAEKDIVKQKNEEYTRKKDKELLKKIGGDNPEKILEDRRRNFKNLIKKNANSKNKF